MDDFVGGRFKGVTSTDSILLVKSVDARVAATDASRYYGSIGKAFVKKHSTSYHAEQPVFKEEAMSSLASQNPWDWRKITWNSGLLSDLSAGEPCWALLYKMSQRDRRSMFDSRPAETLVTVKGWVAAVTTRKAIVDMAAWLRCDTRCSEKQVDANHMTVRSTRCRLEVYRSGTEQHSVVHMDWHQARNDDEHPTVHATTPVVEVGICRRMGPYDPMEFCVQPTVHATNPVLKKIRRGPMGQEDPMEYFERTRKAHSTYFHKEATNFYYDIQACLTSELYAKVGEALRNNIAAVLGTGNIDTQSRLGKELKKLKDDMIVSDRLMAWLHAYVMAELILGRDVQFDHFRRRNKESFLKEATYIDGHRTQMGEAAVLASLPLILMVSGSVLRSINFVTSILSMPSTSVALAATERQPSNDAELTAQEVGHGHTATDEVLAAERASLEAGDRNNFMTRRRAFDTDKVGMPKAIPAGDVQLEMLN
eukprot:TRINITY_DN1625_c0_g1_i2.p1 TRINITY_DN1625_c0_g1~~TRINITY_DN1625_c0_g1_i2.p1  ORF type:complete len:480 (+),score=37.02 TRINITY_DN1625_c0_g1_i2:225-1664(+)